MEYQRIRFNHDSHSQLVKLLTQREFYPNQKPYTKAFHSDPYVVKRFNKPVSFTGHEGCVNTVVWNDAGNLILSGSDDCHLNIWSPFDNPDKPLIHSVPSGHTSNIFSAKFMPNTNDRHIVSCSSDGIVRFTDLNDYIANSPSRNWQPLPAFQCHSNMAYEVLPFPDDSNVFFSCADDGRINKYDLRISTSCNHEHCKRHTFLDLNIKHNPRNKNQSNNNNKYACPQSEPEPEQQPRRRRRFARSTADMGVTAISIRPDNPAYLAAACGDDTVRIYDQRFVRSQSTSNIPYHRDSQVYQFIPKSMRQKQNEDSYSGRHRMTSMKFDPNGGGDLCVSYSSEKVYLVRPGAGLIDKPRKIRKGAVRISKKQKRDSESESKHSEDSMEIDNINTVTEPSSLVDKGRLREENLTDFGKERDTIPTSSGNIVKVQIDYNDGEILSDQDDQQNQQDLWAEIQNINDVKDEDEEEEEEDEYEDDHMYSSDENDEEEDNIEEAYDEDVVMSYTGHLNSKTMIKEAYFYGAKSEYILSGSDDRRIFIWDKLMGKVVNLFIGDQKVVNCVQPHPYYPIICTSGIDYDVKLWYPGYPEGEENDISNLEEILSQNKETRELRRENYDLDSGVFVLPLSQVMQLFALINETDFDIE